MAFGDLFEGGTSTKKSASSSGFGSLFDNLDEKALTQRHKIAQYEYEDQLAKAESKYRNSWSTIAKDTAKSTLRTVFVDIPKSIIGGTASAVATPIQAGISALRNNPTPAALPDLNIPLLGKVPVKTAQKAAADYSAQGDSVPWATTKAFGQFLLDEPAGVVFKPILAGLGISIKLLRKTAPALNEAKSLEEAVTILKKEAPKVPESQLRSVIQDAARASDSSVAGVVDNATASTQGGFADLFDVPARPTQAVDSASVQAPNTRASKLEQAAIERKLTQGLGDLPTHNRINMNEQMTRATQFLDEQPDLARQIINGDAVPPRGVLPESLYTAAEIRAIQRGDVEMIRALSQSKIPTYAGQALKALDSVDPNSPVRIMREINASRTAKIEGRGEKIPSLKVREVKSMEQEIAKSVKSGRPDWDTFIAQITCGY